MAGYESAKTVSMLATITNGVANVIRSRFVTLDPAGAGPRSVKTLVPGALGAYAIGICAMKPDRNGPKDGQVSVPVHVPDGGIGIIELGQAVAQGDPLRVGGNGAEVDGAAYKADAAGDVIVGFAEKAGGVGEFIGIHFVGFAGVAP
jgi:hypothetical protein